MRNNSSFCYSNPNSLGTNMRTMIINDELIDNMLIDDVDMENVIDTEINETNGVRKNTSAHLTDINDMMAQFNAELTSLRNKNKKSPTSAQYTGDNGNIGKLITIVLWTLLIYTAICCSYLAYVHFSSHSALTEQNNSANSTLSDRTMEPTLEPTLEPTMYPRTHFAHSVGDYKLSSNTVSHGRWLLCDGAMYAISAYPELYAMIGDAYGDTVDDALFAVPDARDRVIGMSGMTHAMGSVKGSESVQLDEDHLPSHHHYISNEDVSTGTYDSSTRQYLSITNGAYILYGSDSEPHSYKSGNTGKGMPFDVHQPTIYMANVFIYA